MDWKKIKHYAAKTWHFIWHDDSLLSWIVNIILMFLIIRYIFYPGVGLILGTQFPVVAVVSESMEHNNGFEAWWIEQKQWYNAHNISKEQFQEFSFTNGFNKGDIMVLVSKKNVDVGDIITFQANKQYPIIHRVVDVYEDSGITYYKTKGDNNRDFITRPGFDETQVAEDIVLGRAVMKIPYLGWVKIIAVSVITGEWK